MTPEKSASAKHKEAKYDLQKHGEQLLDSHKRDSGKHCGEHDGKKQRERQRRRAEKLEDEPGEGTKNNADERTEETRLHGGGSGGPNEAKLSDRSWRERT